MKLLPKDLAEIKRIVGSAQPSPVRPGVRKNKNLLDIANIMERYNLDIDDAFDCAARLLQLSPDQIGSHLAVEQRSVKTVLSLASVDRLDAGRLQMHFPGERPLEKFAPRPQWKPQDVIDMKHHMVRFYESAFGLVMASESVQRAGMDVAYAHEAAAESRNLWAREDLLLIFAKDSYLDMLEAAAVTAPSGALNDDELLAPYGVLFFEHERNVLALTAADDSVPIRAITWRVDDQHLTVQVMIDAHYELNNPGRIEPPADCYAYLYQLNLLKMPMRNPHLVGNEEQVNALLGYLRSIRVIAQSAATASTEALPKHQPKKKRGKTAHRRQASVRVLSLRNADHGRYELEAATGKKVRQHWVRGHWRNQWYPSLEDNRAIWIDGHIKGDASLGSVTGPKVHVAR